MGKTENKNTKSEAETEGEQRVGGWNHTLSSVLTRSCKCLNCTQGVKMERVVIAKREPAKLGWKWSSDGNMVAYEIQFENRVVKLNKCSSGTLLLI